MPSLDAPEERLVISAHSPEICAKRVDIIGSSPAGADG